MLVRNGVLRLSISHANLSSLIVEIVVLWAFFVSTSTLSLWKTRVLVVGEEDEGEVNVHHEDDWSDHEENLHGTTWKGWALIEVSLTVVLLIFVSIVALLFRIFVLLVSTHGREPLLGGPADLLTEDYAVNENVLVPHHVHDGDKWLGQAEEEKIQLSVPGAVSE